MEPLAALIILGLIIFFVVRPFVRRKRQKDRLESLYYKADQKTYYWMGIDGSEHSSGSGWGGLSDGRDGGVDYIKHLFAITALAFCAACTATGSDTAAPTPEPASDICGASDLAGYIGQPVTALETRLILKPVRVIRSGMAVTMDFVEDRLNIQLDADDLITQISCG